MIGGPSRIRKGISVAKVQIKYPKINAAVKLSGEFVKYCKYNGTITPIIALPASKPITAPIS